MNERIFTTDERHLIEDLARKRGFKTVRDYMRALIEEDAVRHGESAPLDDELTPDEIRESVKQGLREAIRGDYVSLETLWADDDE